MRKIEAEQARPDGENMPRWKQFLLCYLLMAAGSAMGMLLADGFRWYEWWQAVCAYAVGAIAMPIFAYIFGPLLVGYSMLMMFVEPSFSMSKLSDVGIVGGVCLAGVISFLMLILSRHYAFGPYPLWKRWAGRFFLVAYPVAVTCFLFYMTARG